MTQSVLVPSTTPVAERTAEAHLTLSGSSNESPSKRIHFSRGVTIVGVKVSISPSTKPPAGRRVPTLNDVLVRLDASDLPNLTKTDDDDTTYEKYSSASAVDLSTRYMMAELPGAPDITVRARWKCADNSTAIFEDSVISVALLYNPKEAP